MPGFDATDDAVLWMLVVRATGVSAWVSRTVTRYTESAVYVELDAAEVFTSGPDGPVECLSRKNLEEHGYAYGCLLYHDLPVQRVYIMPWMKDILVARSRLVPIGPPYDVGACCREIAEGLLGVKARFGDIRVRGG